MTEPTPPAAGRVIDLSVEVPGSPEEVWAAIATGPGITSWFVPHDVEERAGGAVSMDFGSFGVGKAEVTAWDPPRRLVVTGGDERVLAYEWTVQARDGGTCVVRLVNSGFGHGAEWDADFDGMTMGWRLFLENLRLHRTYFAGRSARAIVPQGAAPGPHADAWIALCRSIGVAPDLTPGSAFETSGDGVPALRGRVETVLREPRLTTNIVVLDEPAPGTGILAAEGEGAEVMLSFYQYRYGGDGAAPTDVVDDWAPFFAEHHPPRSP
jgi:proline-rich tail region repeat protein